jgi:DNA invertase Pin-like site-specific DNA recombinase
MAMKQDTPVPDSGLRCAIYARKSTDDNDRNEENKSVTRQVDHARKFAEKKGWTVSDQHVYVDDGISGAEFKRRPGLLRMLTHLKEFDCIIMSELSRLGREQTQTSGVLADIYSKGRRIFFYLNSEELRFKSAVDKFMVNAVSFGAELEREKAAQRARDALERQAAKGFNPGGACYGYQNVPIFGNGVNGERVRTHTDYRIHPAESEVIRGIFRAYADGYGHVVIAKSLNGSASTYGTKGARQRSLQSDFKLIRKQYFHGRTPPAPQRGKRGTGSWALTMIREVLYRERYTGVVPFAGKMTERPDLRIVDAALWSACRSASKESAQPTSATVVNGGDSRARKST